MRDNAYQQPYNFTFVTIVHCVNGEVTGAVMHQRSEESCPSYLTRYLTRYTISKPFFPR